MVFGTLSTETLVRHPALDHDNSVKNRVQATTGRGVN